MSALPEDHQFSECLPSPENIDDEWRKALREFARILMRNIRMYYGKLNKKDERTFDHLPDHQGKVIQVLKNAADLCIPEERILLEEQNKAVQEIIDEVLKEDYNA